MAIIITEPTALCHLSKAPIVYAVSGTQYVSNDGALSSLEWGFSSAPINNQTFTFEPDFLQGGVIVFTAKSIPFNANDIPLPPAGILSDNYFEYQLIPALLQNPLIADNYDVIYNGALGVIFRAKEFGSTFDVSITSSGGNHNSISSSNGANLELTPNYKLRYRVHLETYQNSGEFVIGEWFFVVPETDGTINLDVSRKLDEMFTEQDVLSPASDTIVRASKSARRFRVEAADHYGSNPFGTNSKVTGLRSVIKGAMGSNNEGDDFESVYITQKLAITNKANNEVTYEDQPQWLHFVMNFSPSFVNDRTLIVARVWYTDGTVENDILVNTNDIKTGELWSIPCGFNQIGLDQIEPTKTPYKFSIRAYSAFTATEILKEKIFLLPVKSSYSKTVHYLNAFGLHETLCFENAANRVESVQRQRSMIDRGQGVAHENSDSQDYSVVRKRVYELSTTAINKKNAQSLVDLYLSKKHWLEFQKNAGQMYAAKILSDGGSIPGLAADGNHTASAMVAFEMNESEGNSLTAENS